MRNHLYKEPSLRLMDDGGKGLEPSLRWGGVLGTFLIIELENLLVIIWGRTWCIGCIRHGGSMVVFPVQLIYLVSYWSFRRYLNALMRRHQFTKQSTTRFINSFFFFWKLSTLHTYHRHFNELHSFEYLIASLVRSSIRFNSTRKQQQVSLNTKETTPSLTTINKENNHTLNTPPSYHNNLY